MGATAASVTSQEQQSSFSTANSGKSGDDVRPPYSVFSLQSENLKTGRENTVKKTGHLETDIKLYFPKKNQEYARQKPRRRGSSALHIWVFFSFVVALASVIMSTTLYLQWSVRKEHPPSSLLKVVADSADDTSGSDSNLDEFQGTLERFLMKIEKWVERQLEVADEKQVEQLKNLKSEVEVAIRDHLHIVGNQVDKMHEQIQEVENSLKIIEEKGLLTVSEAMDLINNALKEKVTDGDNKGAISLDDIRATLRRIVEAEIEKHSADGIGMVDYAIASGGGRVLGHSEGYYPGLALSWRHMSNKLIPFNHPLANEILKPRFGEPGKCLPLKGSNVSIIIGLRTSIFAEAITMEHISKNVAYDLSSAPKHFKVYGANSTNENKKFSWVPIGEFTYDVYAEKNIQTFSLVNENTEKINRVRLHILSNYGSQSHTCIYRVRVHGYE